MVDNSPQNRNSFNAKNQENNNDGEKAIKSIIMKSYIKENSIKHTLLHILHKILFFLPCLLGKIYLKIFWIIPPVENKNESDSKEYENIYIAGFKFFLIYNSYFLFIYFFVKICLNNILIFKILYHFGTNLLFTICLNLFLFSIAFYLMKKHNLKNIKDKLKQNEKIIFCLDTPRISDFCLLLFFSYLLAIGPIQIFIGLKKIPFLYVLAGVICIYGFFAQSVLSYSTTIVLTNKRFITEKFFKCLLPLYLSLEQIKEFEMKNNKSYFGIKSIKNDIYFSSVNNIENKIQGFSENFFIVLHNGVSLLFKTDKDFEIKKVLNNLLNEYKEKDENDE